GASRRGIETLHKLLTREKQRRLDLHECPRCQGVPYRGSDSERERIGQTDPAPSFDHRQERRAGALVLFGAEAHFRSVEAVPAALDRLQRLYDTADDQVRTRLS